MSRESYRSSRGNNQRSDATTLFKQEVDKLLADGKFLSCEAILESARIHIADVRERDLIAHLNECERRIRAEFFLYWFSHPIRIFAELEAVVMRMMKEFYEKKGLNWTATTFEDLSLGPLHMQKDIYNHFHFTSPTPNGLYNVPEMADLFQHIARFGATNLRETFGEGVFVEQIYNLRSESRNLRKALEKKYEELIDRIPVELFSWESFDCDAANWVEDFARTTDRKVDGNPFLALICSIDPEKNVYTAFGDVLDQFPDQFPVGGVALDESALGRTFLLPANGSSSSASLDTALSEPFVHCALQALVCLTDCFCYEAVAADEDDTSVVSQQRPSSPPSPTAAVVPPRSTNTPTTNHKFDPHEIRNRLESMLCSDMSSFVSQSLFSFLETEMLPHRQVSKGNVFLEDFAIQVTHDAVSWIASIKTAWTNEGERAVLHRKPFFFFGVVAVVLCARLRHIAEFRDIDKAQYGQSGLKRLLKCLRSDESAVKAAPKRRRPTVDSFLQNLLGAATEPPPDVAAGSASPNDSDDDSNDSVVDEPVAAVLSFLHEQEATLRRRLSLPSIEYLGVGSWLRILQRSADVRQVIVPIAEKLLLRSVKKHWRTKLGAASAPSLPPSVPTQEADAAAFVAVEAESELTADRWELFDVCMASSELTLEYVLEHLLATCPAASAWTVEEAVTVAMLRFLRLVDQHMGREAHPPRSSSSFLPWICDDVHCATAIVAKLRSIDVTAFALQKRPQLPAVSSTDSPHVDARHDSGPDDDEGDAAVAAAVPLPWSEALIAAIVEGATAVAAPDASTASRSSPTMTHIHRAVQSLLGVAPATAAALCRQFASNVVVDVSASSATSALSSVSQPSIAFASRTALLCCPPQALGKGHAGASPQIRSFLRGLHDAAVGDSFRAHLQWDFVRDAVLPPTGVGVGVGVGGGGAFVDVLTLGSASLAMVLPHGAQLCVSLETDDALWVPTVAALETDAVVVGKVASWAGIVDLDAAQCRQLAAWTLTHVLHVQQQAQSTAHPSTSSDIETVVSRTLAQLSLQRHHAGSDAWMAEILRIATALPRGILAGRLFAQWFYWLHRHLPHVSHTALQKQFLEAVGVDGGDGGGIRLRAQLMKVIGDLVHMEDHRAVVDGGSYAKDVRFDVFRAHWQRLLQQPEQWTRSSTEPTAPTAQLSTAAASIVTTTATDTGAVPTSDSSAAVPTTSPNASITASVALLRPSPGAVAPTSDPTSTAVVITSRAHEEARRFIRQLLVDDFAYDPVTLHPPAQDSAAARNLRESLELLAKNLYSSDVHFVMELIQNADDNRYTQTTLAQPQQEPRLLFVLDQEALSVWNNEDGFQPPHMAALCRVGRSTKKHQPGYIGQKGIGFKSVFSVSDRPEVHSNGFHVAFDRSVSMLEPIWIGDEQRWPQQPRQQLQQHPHRAPTDVSGHFETCLRLPFDAATKRNLSALRGRVKDVFDGTLLLFLRQLARMTLYNAVAREVVDCRRERWAPCWVRIVETTHRNGGHAAIVDGRGGSAAAEWHVTLPGAVTVGPSDADGDVCDGDRRPVRLPATWLPPLPAATSADGAIVTAAAVAGTATETFYWVVAHDLWPHVPRRDDAVDVTRIALAFPFHRVLHVAADGRGRPRLRHTLRLQAAAITGSANGGVLSTAATGGVGSGEDDAAPRLHPLYAFLPTTQACCPFVVQADFLLPTNRESISAHDPWNTMLLQALPPVFAQMLQELSDWLFEPSQRAERCPRLSALTLAPPPASPPLQLDVSLMDLLQLLPRGASGSGSGHGADHVQTHLDAMLQAAADVAFLPSTLRRVDEASPTPSVPSSSAAVGAVHEFVRCAPAALFAVAHVAVDPDDVAVDGGGGALATLLPASLYEEFVWPVTGRRLVLHTAATVVPRSDVAALDDDDVDDGDDDRSAAVVAIDVSRVGCDASSTAAADANEAADSNDRSGSFAAATTRWRDGGCVVSSALAKRLGMPPFDEHVAVEVLTRLAPQLADAADDDVATRRWTVVAGLLLVLQRLHRQWQRATAAAAAVTSARHRPSRRDGPPAAASSSVARESWRRLLQRVAALPLWLTCRRVTTALRSRDTTVTASDAVDAEDTWDVVSLAGHVVVLLDDDDGPRGGGGGGGGFSAAQQRCMDVFFRPDDDGDDKAVGSADHGAAGRQLRFLSPQLFRYADALATTAVSTVNSRRLRSFLLEQFALPPLAMARAAASLSTGGGSGGTVGSTNGGGGGFATLTADVVLETIIAPAFAALSTASDAPAAVPHGQQQQQQQRARCAAMAAFVFLASAPTASTSASASATSRLSPEALQRAAACVTHIPVMELSLADAGGDGESWRWRRTGLCRARSLGDVGGDDVGEVHVGVEFDDSALRTCWDSAAATPAHAARMRTMVASWRVLDPLAAWLAFAPATSTATTAADEAAWLRWLNVADGGDDGAVETVAASLVGRVLRGVQAAEVSRWRAFVASLGVVDFCRLNEPNGGDANVAEAATAAAAVAMAPGFVRTLAALLCGAEPVRHDVGLVEAADDARPPTVPRVCIDVARLTATANVETLAGPGPGYASIYAPLFLADAADDATEAAVFSVSPATHWCLWLAHVLFAREVDRWLRLAGTAATATAVVASIGDRRRAALRRVTRYLDRCAVFPVDPHVFVAAGAAAHVAHAATAASSAAISVAMTTTLRREEVYLITAPRHMVTPHRGAEPHGGGGGSGGGRQRHDDDTLHLLGAHVAYVPATATYALAVSPPSLWQTLRETMWSFHRVAKNTTPSATLLVDLWHWFVRHRRGMPLVSSVATMAWLTTEATSLLVKRFSGDHRVDETGDNDDDDDCDAAAAASEMAPETQRRVDALAATLRDPEATPIWLADLSTDAVPPPSQQQRYHKPDKDYVTGRGYACGDVVWHDPEGLLQRVSDSRGGGGIGMHRGLSSNEGSVEVVPVLRQRWRSGISLRHLFVASSTTTEAYDGRHAEDAVCVACQQATSRCGATGLRHLATGANTAAPSCRCVGGEVAQALRSTACLVATTPRLTHLVQAAVGHVTATPAIVTRVATQLWKTLVLAAVAPPMVPRWYEAEDVRVALDALRTTVSWPCCRLVLQRTGHGNDTDDEDLIVDVDDDDGDEAVPFVEGDTARLVTRPVRVAEVVAAGDQVAVVTDLATWRRLKRYVARVGTAPPGTSLGAAFVLLFQLCPEGRGDSLEQPPQVVRRLGAIFDADDLARRIFPRVMTATSIREDRHGNDAHNDDDEDEDTGEVITFQPAAKLSATTQSSTTSATRSVTQRAAQMWREAMSNRQDGDGNAADREVLAHCASVWDAFAGWYGSLQSTAALTTLMAVLQWPRCVVPVDADDAAPGTDGTAVDEDLGDLEVLTAAANDICDTVLTVASAMVRRASPEAWQTLSQSQRMVALQQRLRVAVVRDEDAGGVQLPMRLLSIAGDYDYGDNDDDRVNSSDVLVVGTAFIRQQQKQQRQRQQRGVTKVAPWTVVVCELCVQVIQRAIELALADELCRPAVNGHYTGRTLHTVLSTITRQLRSDLPSYAADATGDESQRATVLRALLGDADEDDEDRRWRLHQRLPRNVDSLTPSADVSKANVEVEVDAVVEDIVAIDEPATAVDDGEEDTTRDPQTAALRQEKLSQLAQVAKLSHRQRQKAAQLRLLAEFQRTGALPPPRALATITHSSMPSITTGGRATVVEYRLLEDDSVSPEEKDTFLAMLRAAAGANTATVPGSTASDSNMATVDGPRDADEATTSPEDDTATNAMTRGESARHVAFEALVRQLAATQIAGTADAHGHGLGDALTMVQRYDLPFTLDDLDEPGSFSAHARENVAVVTAKKLLVGRRGEQLVLQYFQAQRDALGLHAVTWMNATGESKLPYDFVLQFRDTTGTVAHEGSEGSVSSRRMFVEVKTRAATSDQEQIDGWHISASELDAARQHGPDYALVLVLASSSGTRLFCIGLPRSASDSQSTGLWPALMLRHEVSLLLHLGA